MCLFAFRFSHRKIDSYKFAVICAFDAGEEICFVEPVNDPLREIVGRIFKNNFAGTKFY